MKVYVVITNGEEVKGEVEGVFKEYEDAKAKFNEIVADWKEWADGDQIEEDTSEDNFYCMTNFDQSEYMEVWLVEQELQ